MEVNKGFKVRNRQHSSVKIIRQTLIKAHQPNFEIKAKKFIISYSIEKKQLDKLSSNKKYCVTAFKNERKQSQLQQAERERMLRMQRQTEEKLKRKRQMVKKNEKKQNKRQNEQHQCAKQFKNDNTFKKNLLQKQKSEKSLIIEYRKDNYKMMKKAKLFHSKSQLSIANQSLKETIFNHKFQQQRKKLQKQCKKYELQYRKSFLKNKKAPKQLCSKDQLSEMLQSKSKQLRADLSNRKFAYSSQTKRSASPQLKTKTIDITPVQSRNSHRDCKISYEQKLIERKIGTTYKQDAKHIAKKIIANQQNPQIKHQN